MENNEPIIYTAEELKHCVRIPSGRCPIKMSEYWHMEGECPPDTVICSWFWAVRQYGLRRGEFLTAEAIAYWSRYEFSVFGDSYSYITEVIYEYAQVIGDHKAPEGREENE